MTKTISMQAILRAAGGRRAVQAAATKSDAYLLLSTTQSRLVCRVSKQGYHVVTPTATDILTYVETLRRAARNYQRLPNNAVRPGCGHGDADPVRIRQQTTNRILATSYVCMACRHAPGPNPLRSAGEYFEVYNP
jgi:hypothetical protein